MDDIRMVSKSGVSGKFRGWSGEKYDGHGGWSYDIVQVDGPLDGMVECGVKPGWWYWPDSQELADAERRARESETERDSSFRTESPDRARALALLRTLSADPMNMTQLRTALASQMGHLDVGRMDDRESRGDRQRRYLPLFGRRFIERSARPAEGK